MANFLIHQKAFHVRSLITRKLNNFSRFFIFLYGTVAGKILFESLTYAFHVQIIRETRYGRDTLAPVALLHTDVHFLLGRYTAFIARILKGVCRLV